MENISAHPSPEDAAGALGALSADRSRLASRVRVPWTLLAALGLMAAWWVSSAAFTNPGADYQPPASALLPLVGVVVIAYLIRRETGVRFRSMGARAGSAVAGIVVVSLVLFSVSLGLVSFGVHWAVVLTSLLTFAVTTWLAGSAYRSAVVTLRDV